MKHLLVTNDFPPKIGGIQNLLWEWWRRLPPDSFAVLTSPHVGSEQFDAQQPYKVIDRTNEPFIWPNQPYEKVGEVNEVCFVEGLVPYKGKWFLYYGTADSKIAVSIK